MAGVRSALAPAVAPVVGVLGEQGAVPLALATVIPVAPAVAAFTLLPRHDRATVTSDVR